MLTWTRLKTRRGTRPMTPDDAYALALGTGDRYPALLAAALNGVGEGQDAEPECELVVEEPDF